MYPGDTVNMVCTIGRSYNEQGMYHRQVIQCTIGRLYSEQRSYREHGIYQKHFVHSVNMACAIGHDV